MLYVEYCGVLISSRSACAVAMLLGPLATAHVSLSVLWNGLVAVVSYLVERSERVRA